MIKVDLCFVQAGTHNLPPPPAAAYSYVPFTLLPIRTLGGPRKHLCVSFKSCHGIQKCAGGALGKIVGEEPAQCVALKGRSWSTLGSLEWSNQYLKDEGGNRFILSPGKVYL